MLSKENKRIRKLCRDLFRPRDEEGAILFYWRQKEADTLTDLLQGDIYDYAQSCHDRGNKEDAEAQRLERIITFLAETTQSSDGSNPVDEAVLDCLTFLANPTCNPPARKGLATLQKVEFTLSELEEHLHASHRWASGVVDLIQQNRKELGDGTLVIEDAQALYNLSVKAAKEIGYEGPLNKPDDETLLTIFAEEKKIVENRIHGVEGMRKALNRIITYVSAEQEKRKNLDQEPPPPPARN